jgi:hypothetical protein
VTGQTAGDKVLVVHPAFSGDRVALDFAVGVQRLVARRLKACGRPAVFALARTRGEDGELVAAAIESWPEDAVTQMAVEQFDCRWVVVPEFAAVEDGCRLTTGLFEVDARRRLRALEAWSFEGANVALPDHLVALVDGIARRTETNTPWADTGGMFGTSDPIPALYYLRALGYCSQLEDGCRVDARQVLATLCVALEAAPAMAPLVELVPEIVHAFARGGANDIELAQWIRELRQRGGADAWPDLMDQARAARAGVD